MLIKKLSETMATGVSCSCGSGESHEHHGHHHDETIRLGVAIFGGILVLNSYLAGLLFPKSIDPFAVELSALIGALILSIPIWISAVRDLIQGKIYMNELVALALLAAFAIHDYRTAGVVAFVMLITIILEQRTAIGAEASIESLIRLTPRRARRVRDDQEEDVDVLSLLVGDTCRVRPGENFPADGTVLSGASSVNQASITGESLPVDKSPGAEVYAGTQNLTGLVEIQVTRVGKDTTLGKVRDLIVAAEKSRLPIMRMVDQYVGFYTPTILTIAALVWFFTGDLHRVIAVLVISCPCALVVATPSAVIAAIAAAARLGILIKDVTHIELAAKISAVVFDKTGTLTEGVLEVAKLHPAPGVELAALLQTATSAESSSNHPTAQALRRLASQAGVVWQAPASYEEVPGKGVVATFGKDVLRVGRASWLRDQGLDVDKVGELPGSGESGGMSIVYVARDRQVLGWIGMRDTVRAGAKEAVDALKELGVKECCMVTGDNESAAQVVAGRLGITEVRAACLPQEKVEFVENLRRQGKLVAVVGDGVNDAPALAAGDIGIAMGAIGSDVAVHSASIALMNNDLRRIPFLISLARRTQSLMNQNLLAGLVLILVGLYLSTIGVVTPIYAALLHGIGTLAIIFNSARLVRAGKSWMVQPVDNTDLVVDAKGLVKVFKDFWGRPKARAVNGLDLAIRRGEVFGLLGPNGSGKSTTVKLLLGLLYPTRGSLEVFGESPRNVAVKRRIGYLPEESYLYRYLTAWETLDFFGALFDITIEERQRRADQLLEMVGLSTARNRPVGEFSKGMARRVGLAQALINDPDLVILDEPTSGLDPIGCREVKDLIQLLARRGKTVILCSHLLADVEDVCDQVVVLYGGKVQAQGSLNELLTIEDKTRIVVPRLEKPVLDRILHILNAATAPGEIQVDHPSMDLESFFLDVVRRAQAASVETAGARTGGRVAEYLLAGQGKCGPVTLEALADRPAPPPATAGAGESPKVPVDAARLDALAASLPPPKPAAPDAVPAAPPLAEEQAKKASERLKSLLDK